MNRFPLFLVSLILPIALFTGCGSVISRELKTRADLTLSLNEVIEDPEAYKGNIAIWGGEVIQTTNQKDGTSLIEVLQRPLDWQEEPERREPSGGRFLVLVKKFLDPEIYRKGREVTVAGEIIGEKTKPLGEMEYRYPLLLNKQLYLWKEYRYTYAPPYYPYNPYYPWGYYGPYSGPWIYAPWSWWNYP
jgi:outer membrane lipoprotein